MVPWASLQAVLLCSVSGCFSARPYFFGAQADPPALSCSFTFSRWSGGHFPTSEKGGGGHPGGRHLGHRATVASGLEVSDGVDCSPTPVCLGRAGLAAVVGN